MPSLCRIAVHDLYYTALTPNNIDIETTRTRTTEHSFILTSDERRELIQQQTNKQQNPTQSLQYCQHYSTNTPSYLKQTPLHLSLNCARHVKWLSYERVNHQHHHKVALPQPLPNRTGCNASARSPPRTAINLIPSSYSPKYWQSNHFIISFFPSSSS